MKIESFDTLEELFATVQSDKAIADARTKDWQKNFKVGDFFLKVVEEGLVIWGTVLQDSTTDEDGNEVPADHDPCYPFTRCFSVLCPYGELGYTHASTIMVRLSEDQFDKVHQLCPDSLDKVIEIVEQQVKT